MAVSTNLRVVNRFSSCAEISGDWRSVNCLAIAKPKEVFGRAYRCAFCGADAIVLLHHFPQVHDGAVHGGEVDQADARVFEV